MKTRYTMVTYLGLSYPNNLLSPTGLLVWPL